MPMGIMIASIPKGRRAELRVSVNEWKGLHIIDLRRGSSRRAAGA